MTDEATAKKKPPRRKGVAPVPDDAFASRQLSLFQGFLANTDNEREALSNAVDLWDSIPRYAISRVRMNAMRTAEGFLDVMELSFNYRGRPLTAVIYPARIKDKDGQRLSYYPSAREELIEHALRKIAAEQHTGFFHQPSYRSGARFSLHQLRKELEQQGGTAPGRPWPARRHRRRGGTPLRTSPISTAARRRRCPAMLPCHPC